MATKKKKKRLEYRYYEIPTGDYVLPLLGTGWEMEYGNEFANDELHFHNYLEVGYCYSGDGELRIQDRIYEYEDDMFTIIPASIPHTTNSKPGHIDKWEFLFIDIDEFINNEMNIDTAQKKAIISVVNNRGTLKSKKNHPAMAEIVLNMIRECRLQDEFYSDALKGYLYALVIEILRLQNERDRSRRTKRVTQYIKNAISYINDNYIEEISVKDISDAVGLSETHFRRIFEESMNMKPVDYVNLVRVDKACDLIRSGDVSMEEVSYKVGFTTQSTFNRNFKKFVGMTPVQWKKKEKENVGLLKNYKISAIKGWEA